jgi:epsilon-lactone hydrolase
MSKANVKTIKLSSADATREADLRNYFADFWATSKGEPRSIYDSFISASPMVKGVSTETINVKDVRGWWVTPANPTPEAAILFIHGGGYVQGSAKAYRGFVSQIVSRTNIRAFAIDYPLAPEATLPAGPNAALAAWQWLVAQGFQHIAIVGDSAGGGLSLVTLEQLSKQPCGPAPVAGVVFSPWADLAFTGKSMTDTAVRDPLISHEYLQDCVTKYRGTFDAKDPLASPLFGNVKGLPQLLIQVGTDEKLLDDSLQFADRAANAGVPVQLEIYEGMHHVFQLDVTHIGTARNALDSAASFLLSAFKS